MSRPFFSVVMPVHNGGAVFERCLEALGASTFADYELLVVDDGSTDGSPQAAERHGARLLRTGGRWGPGRARNLGAHEAVGEYLLFLDADCEVERETLEHAARALAADPGLTALFGSYDDSPAAPAVLSQYKNLQHHWVHQNAREDASTFWAGCGAVRRDAFLAAGGFDADRYGRPSIEDIELGYRLRAAGHRIRVDRSVRVKHHKRWRFWNLVRTDVFDRGIPWTRLMLERGTIDNDLNVDAGGRLSGMAAWLLVVSLVAAIVEPWSLAVSGLCVAALLWANRRFYGFLVRRRGAWFALRAIPLHWLYYLYSVAAFGLGVLAHLARAR